MKFLGYILPLFLLQIFAGCQPEPIDISLDQAPTKLVISSQVIPNQVMIVTVSKSFGALSFSEGDTITNDLLDQILVDSALVTVSYNGITDTLFQVPSIAGVYWSINTPQFLNTDYTLYVHDPETNEIVTSTARMLTQVPFDTTSVVRDTTGILHETTVTFGFTDPSNEQNWYMVNFFAQNNDSIQLGTPFTDSPVTNEFILLSDEEFSSTPYIGTHTLFDWEQDTVLVSMSNISKEYYDYLTLRLQGGTFFTSLFNDPINYPTNVNNGYGYFLTHFPDLRILVIP